MSTTDPVSVSPATLRANAASLLAQADQEEKVIASQATVLAPEVKAVVATVEADVKADAAPVLALVKDAESLAQKTYRWARAEIVTLLGVGAVAVSQSPAVTGSKALTLAGAGAVVVAAKLVKD